MSIGHHTGPFKPVGQRPIDLAAKMFAEDKTPAEVAAALNLSLKTAIDYRARIVKKVGKVGSRRSKKYTRVERTCQACSLRVFEGEVHECSPVGVDVLARSGAPDCTSHVPHR